RRTLEMDVDAAEVTCERLVEDLKRRRATRCVCPRYGDNGHPAVIAQNPGRVLKARRSDLASVTACGQFMKKVERESRSRRENLIVLALNRPGPCRLSRCCPRPSRKRDSVVAHEHENVALANPGERPMQGECVGHWALRVPVPRDLEHAGLVAIRGLGL